MVNSFMYHTLDHVLHAIEKNKKYLTISINPKAWRFCSAVFELQVLNLMHAAKFTFID